MDKFIGLMEELHQRFRDDLFNVIHIQNGYDYLDACKKSGYKGSKELNNLIINSYE